MKMGILRIGQVDSYVTDRIRENLRIVYPKMTSILINEEFPALEDALDAKRQQYRSDIILAKIQNRAQNQKALQRVLGIADIDIFIPQLSFVFGEANRPGKAALISLHRLKPEFYGRKPDMELLVERSTKEAVHELGHTFGLGHCDNPFCVMYFSNSIFETDRKQGMFCHKCHSGTQAAFDMPEEEP